MTERKIDDTSQKIFEHTTSPLLYKTLCEISKKAQHDYDTTPLTIKKGHHELEYEWKIFYRHKTAVGYSTENVLFISAFNTIEYFWCHFNGIMRQIRGDSMANGRFFFFKSFSFPLTEHPSNEGGHHLILKLILPRDGRLQYMIAKQHIITIIEELLVLLIGGSEESELFNGLEFELDDAKKKLFIRLWMNNKHGDPNHYTQHMPDLTRFIPTEVISKKMYHNLNMLAPAQLLYMYT